MCTFLLHSPPYSPHCSLKLDRLTVGTVPDTEQARKRIFFSSPCFVSHAIIFGHLRLPSPLFYVSMPLVPSIFPCSPTNSQIPQAPSGSPSTLSAKNVFFVWDGGMGDVEVGKEGRVADTMPPCDLFGNCNSLLHLPHLCLERR